MQPLQEIENRALWNEVADGTFAPADETLLHETNERYFIRHTRSKDYFSYGHWTWDPADAQTFRSSDIALLIVRQCALSGTELVPESLAA